MSSAYCDHCGSAKVKVVVEEVAGRGMTPIFVCQRCGTAWRLLSEREKREVPR